MSATATRAKPTALDHPALVGFLATIEPNAELQTLRAALEALYGRRASINERAAEVRRRLAEIDTAVIDASGKERDTLAIERAARAGEDAALPGALAATVERLAVAELSYLRVLHDAAMVEARRIQVDELDAPEAELRAIGRQLASAARVPPGWRPESLNAEALGELREEARRIAEAKAPAQARQDRALAAAASARARAEMVYQVVLVPDTSGRSAPGRSWQEAAREAGERAAHSLRAGG